MGQLVQIILQTVQHLALGQHILRETFPTHQAVETGTRPLCPDCDSSDHNCVLRVLHVLTNGWKSGKHY